MILEFLGEMVGGILGEAIFHIPVVIYRWVTGKENSTIGGYQTDYKKFVKFDVAKKFLLIADLDIEHLKASVTNGLQTINEKLTADNFQFRAIDHRTIIQPPEIVSFYTFHFLIQWLADHKLETIGIVETTRLVYSVYNDPDSENLIGKTGLGKRFFISLMEDYSKKQFLRINKDIRTIRDYDVLTIKRDLAQSM